MEKDFTCWHDAKSELQRREHRIIFNEREIWWCRLGLNLGNEQDGKEPLFLRPVLIIRKFTAQIFWGLPLSSKVKEGSYYHNFEFNDVQQCAILFQLRAIDIKRLHNKMGRLSEREFAIIQQKLKGLM